MHWERPDSVTASYIYGCGYESAELRDLVKAGGYDRSSKKDAGGPYKLGGSGAWT